MPTKSKAETYREYMDSATYACLMSLILDEDDNDDDIMLPVGPLTSSADDDEEYSEELDEASLSTLLQVVAGHWEEIARSFYEDGPGSRGPYDGIPRSVDFFSCCLRAPDREFRHIFRVGRDTFDGLVAQLALNPIFTSTGRKPQRHVKFQLGAFLVRYAIRGSDTLWTAKKLGIGFGSVFNYCRRVSRAIRELRSHFLGWPTPQRKAVIADAICTKSGFRKCVGSLDGSLCRFCEPPLIDGFAYMTRKKFSGTNIQASCDHIGRFTSFELGHPGSVPDVTVWKESHLWQHRLDYFQNGEYLLADKGYPSSPYILRPFTEPEVAAASPRDRRRMRDFNSAISSVRIISEHTFGRLKGRFPSLKDMGPHDDIEDLYKAIEALMIIHNICIDWNDKPEYIWRYDPTDPLRPYEEMPEVVDPDEINCVVHGVTEIPSHETDDWLREEGYRKRQAMLDELFPVAEYEV